MAHLSVSVLGEFQASIDDVPISLFESEKVRALLAYLAVRLTIPTAAKRWLALCSRPQNKSHATFTPGFSSTCA
jgi:hypothetical protein